MEKVKVLIEEVEGLTLPSYETEKASGMDVRVNFNGWSPEDAEKGIKGKSVVTTGYGESNNNIAILLRKGDRYLFPTGIKVAVPNGYELQVRPRSGLALKQGISVLNTPGTIDAKLN